MNRFHFTLFVVFIGSLTFLLLICLQSQAATVSGSIVDESGNPVPDIIVSIKSFKGNVIPDRRRMHMSEPVFPPPQPSNTDATGAFSIENIVSPSVNQLTLFHGRESDYEIRGIEMQGIALNIHPHQISWHGGFPFGIEEETDIKGVKITVRLRMRIRGQVLAADGTPLRNARVDLRVKRRYVNGGSGSGGGTETLDIDGGFTRYVDSAAYYTVTVTYQGQSAESQEILLEEGQRLDGLTLTFEEKPEQPRKPNVVRQPPPIRDPARMQAAWQRQREGMWAINPDNRHAYKRIYADTHEEALAQATAQSAHLVAINDKAEQEWILEVFGKKENYWIGSIKNAKEGAKQWDNGDPVTYTNWDTERLIHEVEKDEKTTKNFTILIGVTGKWQQIREGDPVASITEKAILEKKDLIIGAPEPGEDIE